jgi:hypothetical protein
MESHPMPSPKLKRCLLLFWHQVALSFMCTPGLGSLRYGYFVFAYPNQDLIAKGRWIDPMQTGKVSCQNTSLWQIDAMAPRMQI